MRKCLGIFVLQIAIASTANGDAYFRNKNEYKTSDAAKRYFGAKDNYNPVPGIDFGNIQAEISTKMDCGRIDLVTNFEGQFKKIREQATAFVKNIDGYLSAAPMLAVCYMSPAGCAILRHDQFIFSQNLNLRAQACAAINNFIDSQAEKGAQQLQAEAKRNCVSGKLNDGSGHDMASATAECEDTSGMPLRDLSDGLRKTFTNSKQRVLYAMLGQIDETQSYPYLASILGEIEIQEDGYWQPLWPHKMFKPYQVAANTLNQSKDVVCNNLESTLSGTVSSNDFVKTTIKEKLSAEDASNLDDLLTDDRKIACAALGKALGAIAAKRSAAKSEAIITTAVTNGALPEGLREEYRRRSSTAFETLRMAVESEQIPNVEEVRNAVRELASAQRKYNRASAAGLSQSRLQNQVQKLSEDVDCTDTNSCE